MAFFPSILCFRQFCRETILDLGLFYETHQANTIRDTDAYCKKKTGRKELFDR
jgi:hypothetical protein